MKYKTILLTTLILFVCSGLPLSAQSFRKGYKYYSRQDFAAAQATFERYRSHRKHAAAARYFLARMRLANTRDLPGLAAIDHSLHETDSLVRQLNRRLARRYQRKYGVDTAAVLDLRVQTQRWAVAYTRAQGTLPAIDALSEAFPKPLPVLEPEIQAASLDIVNAQLDSRDYDVMTAILRRYTGWVLPDNYGKTRGMADRLWPAFLEQYGPCHLDRFAADHPGTFVSRDCWRDTLQPVLCRGSLSDLLDAHTANRWTALEIALLNAIADRSANPDSTARLSPVQQQQLLDLRQRNVLRGQLQSGAALQDTAAALEQALSYLRGYAPRYSAYRLLEESFQFFLQQTCYTSAAQLLEGAQPYFPDTLPAGCHSNFDYQRRVQRWIRGKRHVLEQPGRQVTWQELPVLNTPEGDESNPVVSPDGQLILFAASGRPDNLDGQDVYRSHWDSARNDWTPPALVRILSGPGDQAPLSISADGSTLLLFIDGRLHTSRRNNPEMDWSAPEPLPVSGIAVIGKGCLSASGDTLLLEGAYTAGSATQAPDLDLFVSIRDRSTGLWSRPYALGATVNTEGDEASPCLSADGKTLCYTSTGYPGLGRNDLFVARHTDADWTHWTRPENLGKEINHVIGHRGFSTVSPDGRHAWCSVENADGKRDLWAVHMEH